VNGRTALAHAAARGDLEILRLLLAQAGDEPPPGVDEALHAAVSRGRLASLNLLLASGADPNARVGLHGGTSLAAAVRREDLEAVRLLLAAGADPRIVDAGNASPLDAALALVRSAGDALTREQREGRAQVLRLLRKHVLKTPKTVDALSLGPATYTVGPRARPAAP
jgi:ankyrin repeat protein